MAERRGGGLCAPHGSGLLSASGRGVLGQSRALWFWGALRDQPAP